MQLWKVFSAGFSGRNELGFSLRAPNIAQTLPKFSDAKRYGDRVKSSGFSHFGPVDTVCKTMAQDGKCSWKSIQHGFQRIFPFKSQIMRMEENSRYLFLVDFRHGLEARHSFERESKLRNEKIEHEALNTRRSIGKLPRRTTVPFAMRTLAEQFRCRSKMTARHQHCSLNGHGT